MLTLNQISFSFNKGTPFEKIIFNKFSLTVKSGELLTIVGNNGSGKSTLMNLISGELLPDTGQITLDGIDITKDNSLKRASYISRVFQDPLNGSCSDLTVMENLIIATKRGLSKNLTFFRTNAFKEVFYDKLIALGIGLEKYLDTPISQLSGGQRQIISLVMSTLSPAKIILFDEHTAALDHSSTAKVIEITKRVARQVGVISIMITHSLEDALTIGDKIIFLKYGKIIDTFYNKQQPHTEKKIEELRHKFNMPIAI